MFKKLLLAGAMVLASVLFINLPADAGCGTGGCGMGVVKPMVAYTAVGNNQCCGAPKAELKVCAQCKPTIIRQNPVMGSCLSGKCEIVKPVRPCATCCTNC